ncbi:MAG: hypothetical protein P8X70_02900 [Nanoarchaeota archaeon]
MIEYFILGVFFTEAGLLAYEFYKFNKLKERIGRLKEDIEKSNPNYSNLESKIKESYK